MSQNTEYSISMSVWQFPEFKGEDDGYISDAAHSPTVLMVKEKYSPFPFVLIFLLLKSPRLLWVHSLQQTYRAGFSISHKKFIKFHLSKWQEISVDFEKL